MPHNTIRDNNNPSTHIVLRTGRVFATSLLGNVVIAVTGWLAAFFIVRAFVAERTGIFSSPNEEPGTFFFGFVIPFSITGFLMVLFTRWLSSKANTRNQGDGAFAWAAFIPIAIMLSFGILHMLIAAFD